MRNIECLGLDKQYQFNSRQNYNKTTMRNQICFEDILKEEIDKLKRENTKQN